MATCAFIGHRAIYDPKLYAKVLEAMRALLRLKVREDFLFCPYNTFDYLCLPAAIDLRQHSFPKEARLSLMLEDKECDETERDTAPYAVHVPFCLFDRVEAVSTETRSYKANSVNRGLKKVQREALNRATHVFSYVYPELCTPEYQMLLYAQRRGAQIIDLTEPETTAFLQEAIRRLPERERAILQLRSEGLARSDIAKSLGLRGQASVGQIEKLAGRELRRQAKRRYLQAAAGGDTEKPWKTCAVFGLGEVTYQRLSVFAQVVQFLAQIYGIREFQVAEPYCHSGYMSVLQELRRIHREITLTAVTHYPQLPDIEWAGMKERYKPLFDSVENICTDVKSIRWRNLRGIKDLIRRSDFCVCDLSHAALA